MDLPAPLQLRVLRLVSPRPRGASTLALVCRQWQALLRDDELLQLQLICGAGNAAYLDVGSGVHVSSDDDSLQVPVRFEATKRSAAVLNETVLRAARHALLLLRRSACGCAVGTLRLERHNASGISVLVPALVASVGAAQRAELRLRPQQLVELHLTDAVLPTSLGSLLAAHGFGGAAHDAPSSPPHSHPPCQRLRLWNCRASHPSQVAPLALGLASLRLDTFVWAADDDGAAAPAAALMDAEGWRGARRLGLWLPSSSSSSLPPSSWEGADSTLEEPRVSEQQDGDDNEDNEEEEEVVEGWCRGWRRVSGTVEELAVRCAAPRASPSPSMAAALRRALLCGGGGDGGDGGGGGGGGVGGGDGETGGAGAGAGAGAGTVGAGWRALRTLQMDPTLLGSLVRGAGGAAALLAALPSLTALGCVDVAWQRPSSFFETLPLSAAAAHGTAAPRGAEAEAEAATREAVTREAAAKEAAAAARQAAAAREAAAAAREAEAAAAAARGGCGCGLTTLFVCVNSPGAPASTEPHARDWRCLSQDGLLHTTTCASTCTDDETETTVDDEAETEATRCWWGPTHACALSHVVHQVLLPLPPGAHAPPSRCACPSLARCSSCPCPRRAHQVLWRMAKLQRLVVAWYDEDDVPVHQHGQSAVLAAPQRAIRRSCDCI